MRVHGRDVRILLAGLAQATLLAAVAMAEPQDWAQAIANGNRLHRAGNYVEAERELREALRLVPQGGEDREGMEAVTRNSLAPNYDLLGKHREAEREMRKVLVLVAARNGPESDRAVTIANLAGLYGNQRRLGEAERRYREAIAIFERVTQPDDVHLALARSGLGYVLIQSKHYNEADRLLTRAIPVLKAQAAPPVGLTGLAVNNLGSLRVQQGRFAEAARLLEEAVRLTEAECGPAHSNIANPLSNLAKAYAALGRTADAASTYRRALGVSAAAFGANHPLHATILGNYAGFLRRNGRKQESLALEAQSKEVLRDSARRNGMGFTVDAAALPLK